MRTVLRAVIKRVTSRVGMSRAGLEHILKQLHVELGGIPPMARHLVGPHQLPTHFTLLGKSDGRMKMLIADVVLAGAFGVGGVGNSVSSQFMASFRQRSGLLWKENANGVPAASTQICQNHWQTSRRRRRSTRLHQFARTSSNLSNPSA